MNKGYNLLIFWDFLLECAPIIPLEFESKSIIEKSNFRHFDVVSVEILDIEGKRFVKALCKENKGILNITSSIPQIFEHIEFRNPTKIRTYNDDYDESFLYDSSNVSIQNRRYSCVAIDIVGNEFEMICL